MGRSPRLPRMSGPAGGRALTGWLGLAALVCGCLVACTSAAGTPGTLPSVSSRPTAAPSSSGSPSPSQSSDEAAIEAAAIEAAVLAYYAAMDEAAKTGNVSAFEAASLATCPCRDFSEAVSRRFAGGRLVGAGVEVDEVNVNQTAPKRAVVTVVYRTAAYVAESDTGSTESFDASEVKSSLVLLSTSAGWLVQAENVLERT